jgi:hypothetical protein
MVIGGSVEVALGNGWMEGDAIDAISPFNKVIKL